MDDHILEFSHVSTAPDGRHVVIATVDGAERHRDVVHLDKLADRQRFVRELRETLPAISSDGELTEALVESELRSLATKICREPLTTQTRNCIPPGTIVRAEDRENFGRVVEDQGHRCLVHFVSETGHEKTVSLEKTILRTQDVVPFTESASCVRKQEPFPIDLLPRPIKDYVAQGSNACCADTSIVALPLLTTLAACIGTTRRIAPKTSWTAPPVLFSAVVARSGSVKSAGYSLCFQLLAGDEERMHREHKSEMKRYKEAKVDYEKQLSDWKRSKEGQRPEEPRLPIAERFVVDDPTIESLALLLAENPRGLYLLMDELRGFFDGMGAYTANGRSGREEARWLSLFDGRPFNIDRKTGRERTWAKNPGVCVAGTIQPGTLAKVVSNGRVESGLFARFLLVMPDPRPKRWTEEELSDETKSKLEEILGQLKALKHQQVDGESKPIDLPLTQKARERFRRFVDSHGIETFEQGDALAAAWAKLEGYALRFALILHLVRWAAGEEGFDAEGPIDVECIEAGIELSRWFANEAERVYEKIGVSLEVTADSSNRYVERLAEWLASKGGSATEREIRRGPQRYRDGDHIEADCMALVEIGRAKWENGRRSRRIILLESAVSGDSDTTSQSSGENSVVSHNSTPGVATDAATQESTDCDKTSNTSITETKVSPSPDQGPASQR